MILGLRGQPGGPNLGTKLSLKVLGGVNEATALGIEFVQPETEDIEWKDEKE